MRSMLRLGVLLAVCAAGLLTPSVPVSANFVCYDRYPVVDDELRRRGVVVNHACVGSPGDSAVWGDANVKYESGDVDGGPPYTCSLNAVGFVWGELQVYHCHGDPGPYANYTTHLVVCLRAQPFADPRPSCPER